MTTYISLLRGINVSGKKKILMKDLKQMYQNLGFEHVLTFIQSGNVIFKTKNETKTETNIALSEKIAKAILDTFGFEVPVLIKSEKEFQEIFNAMPLSLTPQEKDKKLYYTLLATTPDAMLLAPILEKEYKTEQLNFAHNTLYFYCPQGYGRTKLTNNFFEKKLNVTATTRNHKTMTKLLALLADC